MLKIVFISELMISYFKSDTDHFYKKYFYCIFFYLQLIQFWQFFLFYNICPNKWNRFKKKKNTFFMLNVTWFKKLTQSGYQIFTGFDVGGALHFFSFHTHSLEEISKKCHLISDSKFISLVSYIFSVSTQIDYQHIL